jgi:hypothetical protein
MISVITVLNFTHFHFFTVPCSNMLLSKSLYTVAALSWPSLYPAALFGLLLFQETTKPVLQVPDTQAAVMASRTLLSCLHTALHALSPFMPFVTEELYHHLPHFRDHFRSDSIMVAAYPTHQQVWLSGLWIYPLCDLESDSRPSCHACMVSMGNKWHSEFKDLRFSQWCFRALTSSGMWRCVADLADPRQNWFVLISSAWGWGRSQSPKSCI